MNRLERRDRLKDIYQSTKRAYDKANEINHNDSKALRDLIIDILAKLSDITHIMLHEDD